MTLAEMITSVTTFFTGVLSWVVSLLTTITGNPALFVLTFGFLVCGFVVGIFRRVLRVG